MSKKHKSLTQLKAEKEKIEQQIADALAAEKQKAKILAEIEKSGILEIPDVAFILGGIKKLVSDFLAKAATPEPADRPANQKSEATSVA